MKATIIIPAYNEERGLKRVLTNIYEQIRTKEIEVVVVNDGSSDRTEEIAMKFPCHIVSNKTNKGKGNAMRVGARVAKGENLVFVDADDTYPADKIFEIIEELKEFEVVFTKRRFENISTLNRYGNKIFTKLIRILWGFRGNDPLSGLYGIRKKLFYSLGINSEGFAIEAEIVVKVAQRKIKLKEIDISYKKRIGETKLMPIRDGWIILKILIKLVLIFNPLITFIIPGISIILIGGIMALSILKGPLYLGKIVLDTHSYLILIATTLIGLQILLYGIISGLNLRIAKIVKILNNRINIRRLLYLGLTMIMASLLSMVNILTEWKLNNYGDFLDTKQIGLFMLLILGGLQITFFALLIRSINRDSLE